MMSEQKIEILKLACQAALLSPKIEAKKSYKRRSSSNTFKHFHYLPKYATEKVVKFLNE